MHGLQSFFRCGNQERCDPFKRIHRTPKRDTATTPAFSLREQQGRFDQFRHCFNEERPHEALGLTTPGSVYVASTRPYPSLLSEPTYGPPFETWHAKNMGAIKVISESATFQQHQVCT